MYESFCPPSAKKVMRQSWPYDLWSPVQHETVGSLVLLWLRLSRQQQQSIKLSTGPFRVWGLWNIKLTVKPESNTPSPLGLSPHISGSRAKSFDSVKPEWANNSYELGVLPTSRQHEPGTTLGAEEWTHPVLRASSILWNPELYCLQSICCLTRHYIWTIVVCIELQSFPSYIAVFFTWFLPHPNCEFFDKSLCPRTILSHIYQAQYLFHVSWNQLFFLCILMDTTNYKQWIPGTHSTLRS